MAVNYLDKPFSLRIKLLDWQSAGLQQTGSGYGRKLTTQWMLKIEGERERRVYAVCYSNAATFYIIRNGREECLRDADLDEASERCEKVVSV